MAEFRVAESPGKDVWTVYRVEPDFKVVATFPFGERAGDFSKEIAEALAEDVCEFFNRKYQDKGINKPWNDLRDLTGEKLSLVSCTGDDPYRCRGCSHYLPHIRNEECDTTPPHCAKHCKEIK